MLKKLQRRNNHLRSCKFTLPLMQQSHPSGERSMKGMLRSIGIFSTSDMKTDFSRIDTTWIKNGVVIPREQVEKSFWRLVVELGTPSFLWFQPILIYLFMHVISHHVLLTRLRFNQCSQRRTRRSPRHKDT